MTADLVLTHGLTLDQVERLDRWTYQEIYQHPQNPDTGRIIVKQKKPPRPKMAERERLAEFFRARGFRPDAALKLAEETIERRAEEKKTAAEKTAAARRQPRDDGRRSKRR